MRIFFRSVRRLASLLLLLVCSGLALNAGARTLLVGISDQAPDVYITADGQAGGILGQILVEIARREGWTLQTRACVWAECMQLLESGQIDLLPDVYYSPERARHIAFPHVPALHSWSQIYARPGSVLRSILDLDGLRVAVLSGSSQYDYLSALLPNLGIGAQLLPVEQIAAGFQLVQAGQADAVVADYFFGELTAPRYQLTATPIIFQPIQIYYAAPQGRNTDVLATIDRYLAEWQATPGSVYFQVLSQWRNPQAVSAQASPGHAMSIPVLVALLLALAMALAALMRQHRHQRHRLQVSENRLNTILDNIDAMISIKDRDRRYLYANQRVCEFLGVEPSQLLAHTDRQVLGSTGFVETVERSDKHVLQYEERVSLEEELTSPVTGKTHSFLSVKVPLRSPAGRVEAICALLTDTTEHVQVVEQAHRLAFYDTLTDLPNRRMLIHRLEQSLAAARDGAGVGAILILDLDNFKKINDARGHGVGDKVLQEVAQRLDRATRDRDTVSRVSGDEFIILLTKLGTGLDEGARNAMRVAEKLRLALTDHPLLIEEKPCVLSASIGLTLLQPRSTSVDDVMREADLAMHRAKERAGNCVVFYEQDIQSELEQRLWLEHDLTLALNTPQLCMHIQPQYSPEGRVTGGELLTRWTHPVRGPVPPMSFIPLAEETGLINHLTDWTLEAACEALLDLQRLDQIYPLSLNLSPKRLIDPNFVDSVRNTLERTGAPGNRLIFEITEGVLIQDIRSTAQQMAELNLLGIRFSIDDFGTGYSNLAYLKRLPLYELKIDKSLVQDIPRDPDTMAIAELILSMAEQLGLRVVAEGVETPAQVEFLQTHGCDALQGYLLARPMPVSAWLADIEKRTT